MVIDAVDALSTGDAALAHQGGGDRSAARHASA